ncbi:MAG: hypothetical protein NPIRA03_30590 [Nitrospirales bacterium]|nr:MAG: hypothetical protein NPIRA03_30590 [Nitrospirales bacterium]
MVVKRFLQSFSLPRAASLIMACILLLYWGSGQGAGASSPATQQSPVVPQQGSSPPGYNPPQPGYEYVPNPQHNIYRPFEENYGGPTYIQRKAQPPYVTEYGEPVLEEWQYSGGYQGALNRGEIHYQPGSGYNRHMAPPSQVREQ